MRLNPAIWAMAAVCGCAAGRIQVPEWQGAATALVAEAVKQLNAGRLDRAEAALQLAGELSPGDARVLDGFGCIAWKRGDKAEARAFFDAAFASDSGYEDALLHLAGTKLPDEAAALALVEQALQLNPLNPHAREMLAALAPENRLEQLKARYTKAP